MSIWPEVSLGEVASIDRNSVDPRDIPEEVPYVGLENIERGGQLVNVATSGQANLESSKFRFTKEHILFGKLRPYLAKVSRPNFDGICSTDILPIKSGMRLRRDYLAHFLLHPDTVSRATLKATGINLPRISPTELAKFRLPLPPLDDQQRIAAVLDGADALRAKRHSATALLGSLAQSIFFDMFGDPVNNEKGFPRVTLGSLLDRIDSGYSPQCLDRPAQADEWGVLKLGAVTTCEYLPTQNKTLPSSITANPDNEVKVRDLLLSRKNTYDLVAASVFVQETPPHLLLPDLIFRLIVSPGAPVDKQYLHRLLIHPTKRRRVQELASGSAGSMPNISKARLMNLPIELPSLEMQQKFVYRVQMLESLKFMHGTYLNQLDALFASLQHRAFRGEL